MDQIMSKENLKKLHEVEVEMLDEIVRICDKNNLTYFLVGGTLLGAVRHQGFIPWDDDLDITMLREDYEKFIEIAKKELNPMYMIDNKDTNDKYYLNFTKIRKVNTIFEQDFQADYDGPKGIWVDIFPVDEVKNKNSILGRIQKKINEMIFSILHYKNGFILRKKYVKIKKLLGKAVFLKNSTLLNIQDKILKLQNNKKSKCYAHLASVYSYDREIFDKEDYVPAKKLLFEGKYYKVPNQYEKMLSQVYGDYMKLPPEDQRVTHNPSKLIFNVEETNNEKN